MGSTPINNATTSSTGHLCGCEVAEYLAEEFKRMTA